IEREAHVARHYSHAAGGAQGTIQRSYAGGMRYVAALILAGLCAGCSSPDATRLAALESRVSELEKQPTSAAVAAPASFAPGLGEIMGLNQIRHDHLWSAGENGNCP